MEDTSATPHKPPALNRGAIDRSPAVKEGRKEVVVLAQVGIIGSAGVVDLPGLTRRDSQFRQGLGSGDKETPVWQRRRRETASPLRASEKIASEKGRKKRGESHAARTYAVLAVVS